MSKRLLFYALLFTLVACQTRTNDLFSGDWIEEVLPLDTGISGEPNLFIDQAGTAYLSWINWKNDSLAQLQFSTLEDSQWNTPQTIASGTNWFVNWADFPSLAVFNEQPDHLAAHWLQKRAAGTYDYDIRISSSTDGGRNWRPSFIPHRDSIAAEHGFVTLMPLPKGRMFATWLDGRFTKVESSPKTTDHQHQHGDGAMTLRAAEFDISGNLFVEAEIDHRVCDCCQTDATLGPEGPIVVYRNRSEKEIRDIYISRQVDEVWQEPQKIGNDNWEIFGCPVNGPAIAAMDNIIVVTWFTMAEEEPKVQVVFSEDGGKTFGEAIRIDKNEAIGRVDVVLANEQTALVSFIEEDSKEPSIKLVPVHISGIIGEPIIERPTDLSRKSGFPVLEKVDSGFLLAYTVVEGENTEVKSLRIMNKK